MRKKNGEIVSVLVDGQEKFILAERVKRNKLPSGEVECIIVGNRYDVTDIFTRHTIGHNTYVRRLENVLIKVAKENFKLRGLTASDADLKKLFEGLADEEAKSDR